MPRSIPNHHVNAEDFTTIFRQLPERKLLIRANAPNFTIQDVTDSYVPMIGFDRKDLIGRAYFDVFPDTTQPNALGMSDIAKAFRTVIRTAKPHELHVFRHDVPSGDRTSRLVERYWRTALYPILDEHGKVAHIIQTSANATHEFLTTRELEEARHHLDEALEAGKVGSWSWDIGSDVIVGNAGLAKIAGIGIEEAANGFALKKFMSIIHKDDRDRVVRALGRAVKNDAPFDIEFRVIANARTRWVIGRGRVLGGQKATRFSGVAVDVTERRDLQAQIDLARRQDRLNRAEAKMLQERNNQLQAISRTKEEFVALASHQLRTPATAVKQYVSMVLQGYAGNITELQNEMLTKAFESNERQIEIINQILNTARADTGKLIMTLAPLDVSALVRGITDELRTSIENASHRLIVSLPDQPQVISADNGYLRMAIENLISNADKYTPADGTITVSLKVAVNTLRLAIKDTGVGIQKADFKKLFVKFSRVQNPLSVQAGGSGIGLYLAGEIVRLHGGTIEVASKPQKGTTFTIVLPMLGK